MRHQKLHLVRQNAAVAQDEVLPQAGDVRRIEQRHIRLLGCAVAFPMITRAAGGDYVHPVVHAVLGKGDDVLAGQVRFMESAATVGAKIAVSDK